MRMINRVLARAILATVLTHAGRLRAQIMLYEGGNSAGTPSALILKGDFKGAEALAGRLSRSGSGDSLASAHLLHAELLLELGDASGALEATTQAARTRGLTNTTKLRVAQVFAEIYLQQANAKKAAELLDAGVQQAPDPGADVAATTDYLRGVISYSMGKLDVAREHLLRAVQARKRAAPDSPKVGLALIKLGDVDETLGDLQKSEQDYVQARDILERALGPKHPHTIDAVNNLAVTHLLAGKYEHAERGLQRALDARTELFGEMHAKTAATINNMAVLQKRLGDFDKAEQMYRKAIQINEATLGARHPKTANAMSNLAVLLQGKGDFLPAADLYRRAIEVFTETLGEGHSKTLTAVHNLAKLRLDNAQPEEAEPLLQRALRGFEAQLGSEHPKVGEVSHTLGALKMAAGDYRAAVGYFGKAHQLLGRAYGADHPQTTTAGEDLALCLHALDQHAEALESARATMIGVSKQLA